MAQVVEAQEAGFDGLWISDHHHPWNITAERFRSGAVRGSLVQGGFKVCWGEDEAAGKLLRRLWPDEGLPGELAQILPTPEHFQQVS